MAYEARSHFPDSTIHITNEIIHNPQVRIIISIKLEKGQAYGVFLECVLHAYLMLFFESPSDQTYSSLLDFTSFALTISISSCLTPPPTPFINKY